RAEERRLNYLMSVLINELRLGLERRGLLDGKLSIASPFSNLVAESDVVAMHSAYADDLAIGERNGDFLVFLDRTTAPAPPSITQITIRSRSRTRGRSAPSKIVIREPAVPRRAMDTMLA